MHKYKKQWCRAEVNDILPKGQIIVLFVDDGMNQVVFTSDLRPINAKLVDMPAMAIECSLKSVVPADGSSYWPESTIQAFEEMLLDRKFSITVDEEGAEMYNEEEKSIHEILKEMNLALSPEEAAQALLEREAAEKEAQIVAEKEALIATQPEQTLYFLSANGPAQIVCQPAFSADSLVELMDNIAAFYGDGSNQDEVTPEVGQRCIAQFTEDDGWYRANIESIDEGNITVRYIDYGNSEVVTQDRLRSIQPQFEELPAQAITYTVTPPLMEEDQWKDNMKALLEESCVERELQVTLLDITPDGFSIKLSQEDETFMTACLTAPPPVEEEAAVTGEEAGTSVIFLSAEGPATFVCQPVSTADELATLMDNIAAYYEEEANQAAYTPEVGQQCIAKFTEDDGWYRAVIEGVVGDDVTVRYIDYGNSEVLTGDRLCTIQPQFAELPAQAVTYQLSVPLMQQAQWNEDMKALVDENCAERELSVNLDESSEVPIITLSSVDTDFIKSVLGDSLPPSVSAEAGEEETLELGEAISLIFLSAEGPSSFSCQPTSTADDLAILMDNIAAFYEDEANQSEHTPEVGQQCIAMFTEDDGWYRASVEAISEEGIAVKYIDYGNSETVTQDRVCEIQPQFQELAAQAIVYQIKPDLMHPSQWNDDVKATLDDSCAERELNAHLVNTSDGSLAVKLSKDDVDFIQSSIASILPPADIQASKPKDEVDQIAEALVNTAITDAIEEMTIPESVTDAAGVTVMTLFDKVAQCLLIDELKKGGPSGESGKQEEDETLTGVKKLVDDIVNKAVAVVSGENEPQAEEENLPHQILDEIIESVATGLNINSATEVIDREAEEHEKSDGNQGNEAAEHPSPQRKRQKSGEGLPGMENEFKGEDLADDEGVVEGSEAMEETECPEPKKKPKMKEGESTDGDNDDEEEEAEDFEDAEDTVDSKEENEDAAQDEETTSDQVKKEDADKETEGDGGDDATNDR